MEATVRIPQTEKRSSTLPLTTPPEQPKRPDPIMVGAFLISSDSNADSDPGSEPIELAVTC
jgi:hypothetical protein